jgi:hypothetical protein
MILDESIHHKEWFVFNVSRLTLQIHPTQYISVILKTKNVFAIFSMILQQKCCKFIFNLEFFLKGKI